MTILDSVRVLKRRWVFVAAGLMLGVGIALVANVLLPRQYTSTLTIYISGHARGDYSVQAAQVAQSQVLSYRQLLTEDRVLQDVVLRLGLAETPAELANQIVVSNDPETLLLKVNVTDRSPQRAALIDNSVADSFLRLVAELNEPVGDLQQPVITAQVLQKAVPPSIPSSPQPRLNLALGALVGLLLGAGAALVFNAVQEREARLPEPRTDHPTLPAAGEDIAHAPARNHQPSAKSPDGA